MPELPEVESARAVIERAALGRVICAVDDSDSYECRPHQPGEIRAVLTGRRLTAVHRQGKSMWCDTSGVTGQSRSDAASCGAGRGRRFTGYAAVPAALRHYVELIGIIVGGRAWA